MVTGCSRNGTSNSRQMGKLTDAGSQHGSPHPWQGHVGEIWWARRTRTRGVPLWACLSVYPKTRICFTILRLSPTLLTLTGGYPQPPLCKKINLKLSLIGLLDIIGVFQFKPLWWLSSLPDRFVQIHSLPTMRGMGSLRHSNNAELLRELKLLE